MRVLNLKNGETEIINDIEDIQEVVYNHLGDDVSIALKELCANNSYEQKRFDSDMIAYESQLDEYNCAMNDIIDVTESLVEYVTEAKKLDRKKIDKLLKSIIELSNI